MALDFDREQQLLDGIKWRPEDERSLFIAVMNDDVDRVKQCVSDKTLVHAQDADGSTPLHWAAAYSSDQVCGALIEADADINAIDRWSNTPLHNASGQGQLNNMRVFVDAGADLDVLNEDDRTPLDLAHGKGRSYLQSVAEQRAFEADTAMIEDTFNPMAGASQDSANYDAEPPRRQRMRL